jgi:hypothetical protein
MHLKNRRNLLILNLSITQGKVELMCSVLDTQCSPRNSTPRFEWRGTLSGLNAVFPCKDGASGMYQIIRTVLKMR